MDTFKVTYHGRGSTPAREETVEAESYVDTGDFIDFLARGKQVLRIRTDRVRRIELIDQPASE